MMSWIHWVHTIKCDLNCPSHTPLPLFKIPWLVPKSIPALNISLNLVNAQTLDIQIAGRVSTKSIRYWVSSEVHVFFFLSFTQTYFITSKNSYEKVKTFNYIVSLLTIQNYFHKKIKCRVIRKFMSLFSQKLSFSQLVSNNLKIKK